MLSRRLWKIILTAALSFSVLITSAQQIHEPRTTKEWEAPYQPFRIVGNLYWVGTYDLGCFLITTSKGNILINTGLSGSYAQIKKNIETLGFKYTDIKILLTTQVHYDHVGAMAAIKKETGARFYVEEKDADVLQSGGATDYELSRYGTSFLPIKPDRLLYNNDTISLGEMNIVILHHPGHTKGSCSYLFTVKDEQRSWKVLLANMPTIVTDRKFDSIPEYPEIEKDFVNTFQLMRNISFDIWLASHASQFNMHNKHKPGDPYNPIAFSDQQGYEKALDNLEKQFEMKVGK